jgi:hypothetical protein
VSRMIFGIGRKRPATKDEAQWWRLEVPGSGDVDHENDGSLATWTFPDGYDENIWPTDVSVRSVPAPGMPHMMSRVDPPECWYVDVLMVGPPTPCDRWEELTQPGRHLHPHRTRPVTPEEQAAEDKRVLDVRERREQG